MDKKQKQLEKMVANLNKGYGAGTGSMADEPYELNAIPSGSLALDYQLGTGGWARGQVIEVYGPRDIGKSTVIGLQAIRNAQAQGLLCGIIALEPNFDPIWAERHGVDTRYVIIARPKNGEQAFSILNDWVTGASLGGEPVLDFVLFDSLGAVTRKSEAESGLPSAMGAANLTSTAVKSITPVAYRHNITVMLLNQIRDVTNPMVKGGVKPPGGHAVEHLASQHIYLKPGAKRETIKGDDGEDVLIGREVIAIIKRNKLDEGTDKRAVFWFYQKEVEGYPFGLDWVTDVIDTAITSGVITGSNWYYHESFPGGKIQGKDSVREFLRNEPKVVADIREKVLAKMFQEKEAKIAKIKAKMNGRAGK